MADANANRIRTSIRDGIMPKIDGLRQVETNIRADGVSIRLMFRIAIGLLSAVVFLVIVAISYARVTSEQLERANASVSSEVNYLRLQLESIDARAEAFGRALDSADVLPEELAKVDANDYALLTNPVSEVLEGYTLDETGTVVIAKGDLVLTSDDERMPVGGSLHELLGSDAHAAIAAALADGELQEIPLESALDNEEDKRGYLLAGEHGDLTIVIVEPASMVFRNRMPLLGREYLVALSILAIVFIVVDRLLVRGVANRIDAANSTLEHIVSGDLDARVPREGTREFRALAQGINVTVDALEGWIEEAERRMEEDLATAREIQSGTLPRNFSAIADVERIGLFASMDPAREVGGDFYDFFELDDHTIAFLIADVSGKGIPGALFMMSAKTEIENRLREGIALVQAVSAANTYLCANNEVGMFVTMWVATLDWKTGLLTYVNAGHNYPLLRRGQGGEWEWLKKRSGLFLGTFETATYRQQVLTLIPGDELLLYTDGVNEAFNVEGTEYGNDRLEKFLSCHANLAPEGIVPALRADVASWAKGAEQSDDVTILALEMR